MLSIAIAFIGSYGVIILYEQYRLSSKENVSKLFSPATLLLGMGMSLGGVAIWAMHFVAMASCTFINPLDDSLSLPVRFRIDLTIGSLVIVIATCCVALYIATKDKEFTKDSRDVVDEYIAELQSKSINEIRNMKNKYAFLKQSLFRNMSPLIIGGLLAATGVCVMHYMGMDALVLPQGLIVWNPGIIAASCIIAVIASTAALFILFRLLALFPNIELLRVVCACVMSIAVNGMHYCGQAAAHFEMNTDLSRDTGNIDNTVDQTTAVYGVLVASVLLIYMIITISIADLRVWYNNHARVITVLDDRANYYIQQVRENILQDPFLLEYTIIRNYEGSENDIKDFKAKIKSGEIFTDNTNQYFSNYTNKRISKHSSNNKSGEGNHSQQLISSNPTNQGTGTRNSRHSMIPSSVVYPTVDLETNL